MRRQIVALLGIGILVAIVAAAIGWETGRPETATPVIELPLTHSVSTCLDKRGAAALATNDMPVVRTYLDLCIREVSTHLKLNDYQLRRLKFLGQYYMEKVALWMVVFVTVAGVLLSAGQLATSYKLASRDIGAGAESHEMTIENGRVVIRSSAIGLMVLFISLVFFLIFVLKIYKIDETKQEVEEFQTAAAQAQPSPFRPGLLVPFAQQSQQPAAGGEGTK